jgi:hypothetical protein
MGSMAVAPPTLEGATMYLFTRNVFHAGPPAEYTANAIEMRQFVADRTGRDIALWNVGFGAPAGSMTYSMRVDGLADLDALAAQLGADTEYHARLAAGAAFVGGPVVDHLSQAIHGELGDAPPVGSVALVTTAVIGGSYGAAIGWALEAATHVSGVGGLPVAVMSDLFGTFGALTWIAVAPDGAAMDASNAKVGADADYLAMLDRADGFFVPGQASRFLLTRIA